MFEVEGKLKRCERLSPEMSSSTGQNRALSVFFAPISLDSGQVTESYRFRFRVNLEHFNSPGPDPGSGSR